MTFVRDGVWLVDASAGRMVVIVGKGRFQETNRRIYSRDFVEVYAPCASVGVPFYLFYRLGRRLVFIFYIASVGVPVYLFHLPRWAGVFYLLLLPLNTG